MSTPLFDPHDPNWRCCCGCHVTLGTKIICGLSFAICAISAAATLAVTPGSFLPTFLWLLAVGALFLSPIYGVNKEKPYFLIPYLIISIIGLGIMVFSLLGLIVALSMDNSVRQEYRYRVQHSLPNDYHSEDILTYSLILLILQHIISILLGLWYVSIVYRCYQYLQAMNRAQNGQAYIYSPTEVLVAK